MALASRGAMRIGIASLVLVSTALGAFGCSSGATGSTPIGLSSWCDAVARTFCDRVVPCCRQGGVAVDSTTCMRVQTAQCNDDVAKQQAKGRTYDATAAGECLAHDDAFFDGCTTRDLASWAQAVATDACLHVWTGSTPAGGACTEDADCASSAGGSATCARGGSETQCEVAKRVGLGATCGVTSDGSIAACAPDAWCAYDASGKGTCTAPPTEGQSCAGTPPCADGLECDGSVCRSPGKQGDSCAQVACAKGLYCGASQRCVPPIAEGVACSVSDRCVDGLQCIDGKCARPLPDGATCNWSGACQSGYCDLTPPDFANGTCVKTNGPQASWPSGFDPSLCSAITPK